MKTITQDLMKHKLVAIIRGTGREEGYPTASAMIRGGFRFLEVTLNTEGAMTVIEEVNDVHGGDVYVGAGTVMNRNMAEDAVSAGARFLVSPHFDHDVMAFAYEAEIPYWPGSLTPTEIISAFESGADVVKVFPAGVMGSDYLKALSGPFPDIPLMVTGGVHPGNIRNYFEAGATAAGIGGDLCHLPSIRAGQYESIEAKAKTYVNAMKER
ncbi:bifunctional 4-hydroxy-2-oxoglutarate aldolase/2-dehydro-3-deoxy-phosphogluconate aldolase [Salisediminibacterium selenitireducens]|uniref:2-dehydro-3-deoxyphosphogluconate aldolase/4-hydroxy-2-oxoglutarate aldolase n=1 Tax=Bacillus selenitireducens (strain ATCC 700615 / DSM 15326 / MLS10) TaxID=439292 RepID=D6XXD8_BACIE|nr:bifunctional 4-hydroxy-2-oxoglutarate aldolase/2-dehydro-3-deoxy-phosphogluconate aldolase [Salisediminibacterium selenitireducens]ADH97995.1 2-dehydro-3-deoxyphosphogluconate aldolase/4-hydroxy-2-oxoglutarate aldolase [[Bacillus] selenitireducens MLS10]